MNRFLRVGERYALSKRKPKYIKLRYISLLAVLTTMCLYAVKQVSAQEAEPAATAVADIKPLQIGDTIPEWLWHHPLQVVNHPEGRDTITLNDYRDKKLIILDFWSTWCGSCVAAMPRIHGLERAFVAKMKVVPVSRETGERVAPLLSTNKTVRHLDLFSVVGDEALRTAFPHKLVPHYVWISTAGEVGAVTTSERVNAKNVELFLDGEQARIPIRQEIDANRPLFLSDNIELDDLAHYSVLTKGRYDGLPSGNRFRKENGVVRGRAITNSSVLKLYRAAAYHLFKKLGDQFTPKRLILAVSDTSRLVPQKNAQGGSENLFNFELIVPSGKADSLYEIMLQALNRYTDYHGHIEIQGIKCLILAKIGDLDRIKTKGGKPAIGLFSTKEQSHFINHPIALFINRLNENGSIPLPVVDETGYTENVDIKLSGETALDILRNELRQQNLDLVEGYRPLRMFILEEKPSSSF